MKLRVLPAVEPVVENALLGALREAGVVTDEDPRPEPWVRAALHEAVDAGDSECDALYAFLPRRTRGATRA